MRRVTSFKGRHRAPHKRAVTAYRSGLEAKLSAYLTEKGVEFLYEKVKIRYVVPAREASYTPDWWITSNGIIIESKGIFEVDDRQKHLLIKHQHPDLDIRFVFSNSRAKLYKNSPTSYAKWCDTHGFQYADKLPPVEWLEEAPERKRMAAIKRAVEEPDIKKWALFKLPKPNVKG